MPPAAIANAPSERHADAVPRDDVTRGMRADAGRERERDEREPGRERRPVPSTFWR